MIDVPQDAATQAGSDPVGHQMALKMISPLLAVVLSITLFSRVGTFPEVSPEKPPGLMQILH